MQSNIWPVDQSHNLPVNAVSPPKAFCHDQAKIRQWAHGAIKLKLKIAIVLLRGKKT